jgi:hypothetical protein
LNKPQDIQAENLSRSEREKVNPNCLEDSTFPLQKNPLPSAVGEKRRQCQRISKHGMNILGKNCNGLGTQLLTVYGKKNSKSLNLDREEITLLPFVFCASLAQGKEIDIHKVLPLVCVDNSNDISRRGRNRDFKVFKMLQIVFDPKTKKMASGTKFRNLTL